MSIQDDSPAGRFLRWYQALVASQTGLRGIRISAGQHRQSTEDVIQRLSDREKELFERAERDALGTITSETDSTRYYARMLLYYLPNEEADALAGIPIGSLPALKFNAATVKSPSGDPIIAVAEGIMMTLHEVASWYVASLPMPESGPEVDFMRANLMIFRWAMFHYTHCAADWLPERSHPISSLARISFAGALVTNAMNFILAHEFGHVLLGHLADTATRQHPILTGREKTPALDVYQFSQRREFEADVKGATMALAVSKAAHQGWPGAAAVGTEFALQFIRLQEELLPATLEDRSHPPTTERLERVRTQIIRDAGSQWEEEIQKGIKPICKRFDFVVDTGCKTLAKAGVR